MTTLNHTSAEPSHYNTDAEDYDTFNDENSRHINGLIASILREHEAKTVLDMTCGTGSQVFYLTKEGFQVTGSDFNAKMLEVAKEKASKLKMDTTLIEGDVRTLKIGTFDAVLTIFNAIGHLTADDFEITIRNIHDNLNHQGLYMFDIFNLSYLLHRDNITKLTIDWHKRVENKVVRYIQYSTINQEGVLASFTTAISEGESAKPIVTESSQTLQVYSALQLKELLEKNGFNVLSQTDVDGSKLSDTGSERILTLAQKK